MSESITNAYKQIEDLPAEARKLAAPDLHELAAAWQERKEELQNSDVLKHFNEKLVREWAIEAGTLEKLYEIDRGITLTLIEQGLDASLIPFNKTNKPVELVARILNDHKEALEGVFAFVKQQRELTLSYIKELHQALLKSQKTTEALDQFGNVIEVSLTKGAWKKQPNNPLRKDGTIHEYCPPINVQDEMERLIDWHRQHVKQSVSPEIEAAWLHHRFTQIHPFQDGNGRVARALATLVLLRAGWFPLVFLGDRRIEYLDALEAADRGDIEPVIILFGNVQRKAFQRALSLSEDVLTEHVDEHIQQLINAAGRVLQERRDTDVKHRHKVSKLLEDTAYDFFSLNIAPALQKELQSRDRNYGVSAVRSTDVTADWYHKQIIEVARQLDYFADWRSYRAWVALKIREERQAHIVLAFHSFGVKSKSGLLAAAAFIEYRERVDSDYSNYTEEPEGPYPLCTEPFQFSIRENEATILKRFKIWLNQVVIAGLDQWRRQL